MSEVKEERRALEEVPFDKRFTIEDGTEALCHATGFEVLFEGEWWNEYEGPDGYFYLGR